MFASTIQGMIILGQVIAACVAYGTQDMPGEASWRIPIGLLLAMPVLIFVLLPLLPESPRWLLSRDQYESALKNMRKLRKKATEEEVRVELESLMFANANEHKGTWAEVFDKRNRVRSDRGLLDSCTRVADQLHSFARQSQSSPCLVNRYIFPRYLIKW